MFASLTFSPAHHGFHWSTKESLWYLQKFRSNATIEETKNANSGDTIYTLKIDGEVAYEGEICSNYDAQKLFKKFELVDYKRVSDYENEIQKRFNSVNADFKVNIEYFDVCRKHESDEIFRAFKLTEELFHDFAKDEMRMAKEDFKHKWGFWLGFYEIHFEQKEGLLTAQINDYVVSFNGKRRVYTEKEFDKIFKVVK